MKWSIRWIPTGVIAGSLLATNSSAQRESADKPKIEGRVPNGCSGPHHPGDAMTCYVVFAGKANFTHLELVFNYPDQVEPRAKGKFINFVLRESRKVDDQTYEVSGEVGDCISGKYILAAVSAKLGESGYRLYTNGYQFESALTVDVINDLPESVEEKEMRLTGPAPHQAPAVDTSFETIRAKSQSDPLKLAAGTPRVWEEAKGACGGEHVPGDKLECMVSFDGDPKFAGVMLNFGLRSEIRADEKGICNGVLLLDNERVDERTYRVTGRAPMCATGTYQVDEVVSGESSWSTVLEETVKGNISIRLRNDRREAFPEVKMVAED
jgi:hypothetical protein